MADTRQDAFMEAAQRMEMVVCGVKSRHVAEVQGGPPISTVYVRSDEALDRPIMNDPTETWVQSRPTAKPAPARGWRTHMPYPVRWVMGWP